MAGCHGSSTPFRLRLPGVFFFFHGVGLDGREVTSRFLVCLSPPIPANKRQIGGQAGWIEHRLTNSPPKRHHANPPPFLLNRLHERGGTGLLRVVHACSIHMHAYKHRTSFHGIESKNKITRGLGLSWRTSCLSTSASPPHFTVYLSISYASQSAFGAAGRGGV